MSVAAPNSLTLRPRALRVAARLFFLAALGSVCFLMSATEPPPSLLWAVVAAIFVLHAIELPLRSITVSQNGLEVRQWLRRRLIDRSQLARTAACYDPESGVSWPFLVVHLWEGKRIHVALDIFAPADQEALRQSPWLRVDREALEAPPAGGD